MNWHTRQIREQERKRMDNFLNPPSNKPTLKTPKGYACGNCIQTLGSTMCKYNKKTGKPCKYYTELLAMAKRGELEEQETS